jgi:uncharacterized Tic20 family protein
LIIPLGNILGPLIIWQVKKDEMPFAADQAKEALNFNITMAIAGIVAWLVNQGLKEVSMAEGLKTASLGVAGATATHLVDFAVEWVKARGKAEVAKLSPKKGPTRAKKKPRR